jgi:hypothetical protein
MEKDEMITSENEVVKNYQIPELVDLNGMKETQAITNCVNGSVPNNNCLSGSKV